MLVTVALVLITQFLISLSFPFYLRLSSFSCFLICCQILYLLTLFRFLNDMLENFSVVLQVSVNASVIGFHVLYQLKPVDFLLKRSDNLNSLLH
jgi:hypothetical protein